MSNTCHVALPACCRTLEQLTREIADLQQIVAGLASLLLTEGLPDEFVSLRERLAAWALDEFSEEVLAEIFAHQTDPRGQEVASKQITHQQRLWPAEETHNAE